MRRPKQNVLIDLLHSFPGQRSKQCLHANAQAASCSVNEVDIELLLHPTRELSLPDLGTECTRSIAAHGPDEATIALLL